MLVSGAYITWSNKLKRQEVLALVGSIVIDGAPKHCALLLSVWTLKTVQMNIVAQSAGAEEYTDCISAEDKTPLTSTLDMTLKNLMVRLL